MSGGLAERRLDEALDENPVPDRGNAHLYVGILTGTHVDEEQKDQEIVDFLQIKQKSSEKFYSFIERFEKQCHKPEIWFFNPKTS